jgi:hypothetical protein
VVEIYIGILDASRRDASDDRIRFLYICIFHGTTKF